MMDSNLTRNDIIKLRPTIRKKVQCLLKSYKTMFGSLNPPILIDNLIRVLEGGLVDVVVEESPRGKLLKNAMGKRVIVVPRHFHRTRQRLEAAHEIAHLLVSNHTPVKGFFANRDSIILENELFDYAARMILMPEESLPNIEFFFNAGSISRKLVDIKRSYQVSAHAVARRIFDDIEGAKDLLCVEEVIIWQVSEDKENGRFLVTPEWKLSKGEGEYFIPIGRCFGKENSSAYNVTKIPYCVKMENVRIGNLKGRFVADSSGYWWKDGYFNRIITVFRNQWHNEYALFT